MAGTFEANFHKLGSRASLVPLRGMQQHGYKILKTHKPCSRTSLVALLGCSWASSGVLLGCSWAASGLSWAVLGQISYGFLNKALLGTDHFPAPGGQVQISCWFLNKALLRTDHFPDPGGQVQISC